MGRLLLNSKGLNTRIGCEQIRDVLERTHEDLANQTMFLVSLPVYEVDELIVRNCVEILGFREENLYLSANGIPEGLIPDYIYVTEGNTFLIMDYIRTNGFVKYIQDMVRKKNVTYIGSSAGAVIAGSDIHIAGDFDIDYVPTTDYTGLRLFDGTILPHYTNKQAQRYVNSMFQEDIDRYTRILSVSNKEVLIL